MNYSNGDPLFLGHFNRRAYGGRGINKRANGKRFCFFCRPAGEFPYSLSERYVRLPTVQEDRGQVDNGHLSSFSHRHKFVTAVETQQINNSDWHAIRQRSVPGAGRTLGQRRRRWAIVRPAPGRPASQSPTTGNVSIQYSSFPPLRISNIPPERGARGPGQLTATSQEMRIISLFGQICPVLDLCQKLTPQKDSILIVDTFSSSLIWRNVMKTYFLRDCGHDESVGNCILHCCSSQSG